MHTAQPKDVSTLKLHQLRQRPGKLATRQLWSANVSPRTTVAGSVQCDAALFLSRPKGRGRDVMPLLVLSPRVPPVLCNIFVNHLLDGNHCAISGLGEHSISIRIQDIQIIRPQ